MDVRTTRAFRTENDKTLAYLLVEPLNGVHPNLESSGFTRYEGTFVDGYDVSRGVSVEDDAYVLATQAKSFDEAFASVNELAALVKDSYQSVISISDA